MHSRDLRDQTICEEFKTGAIAKADLAERHGMTVINLRRILKKGGVDDVKCARRPRAFAHKRAISPLHARVGHVISYHRGINLSQDLEECATTVKMTGMRLRAIELGFKSPTIDELERVASHLGLRVTDLLDEHHNVRARSPS